MTAAYHFIPHVHGLGFLMSLTPAMGGCHHQMLTMSNSSYLAACCTGRDPLREIRGGFKVDAAFLRETAKLGICPGCQSWYM